MKNEIECLKNYMQAETTLSAAAWSAFAGIWQVGEVKRKESLTRAGDTEKHLFFILEGVQRVYHLSDHHKDATLVFTYPHSFGGVLDSFLLQAPARYHYEALTASRILKTTHAQFEKVTQKHAELNAQIQQQLYQVIAGLLARMVELQSYSSEEKFRALLDRSPHLLQLIPHKYLANYVGIDPTNFSKLVNRVKI